MHYLRSLFLILFGSFYLSSSLLLSVSGSNSNNNDYSLYASFEYRCGDQFYKIYHPFRVATSPPFCGHPNFELSCASDNKTLVARISGKDYQVKSMDYDTQWLHVTELEFVNQSCIQTFTNTSIYPSLFNYSSDDTSVTVLFNCSSSFPSFDSLYNITCSNSDSEHHSFYSIAMPMFDIWQSCNSIAMIPINQSLVDGLLVTNYEGYAEKFMETLKKGFGLTWKVGDGWCSKCTNTNGICYSDLDSQNSSGGCYCNRDTSNNGGACIPVKINSSAAGMGILVVCLSLALYLYKHGKASNSVIFWKKNLNNNKQIEALLEEYGSLTLKRYSYSNVKKITKVFQEKLGQGGYGTVYKGTLSNGHVVAVKILNDSKGDGEEFINEVASICRTSHVNVVNLLGFCYEGSKRALIYDFMCNGSLEKLLYSEKPKTTHDWQQLYEIAIGIARGLEYLHRGCNTRIVHFDIKPHNILLDQNICPKISDFGLAKLCLKKESIISIAGARGTIGYIAPEVFSRNFGVVSSKSDVYSYGMMVLDIVGGRKNPNEGVENSSEAYFPHWIYAQLNQNGNLLTSGVADESEETVRKMVLVGLWCIQTMPENRPSMSRVIEMMEGSGDDLQIPPKPYLSSSPFGSIIGTSSVQDISCIDCSSSADS